MTYLGETGLHIVPMSAEPILIPDRKLLVAESVAISGIKLQKKYGRSFGEVLASNCPTPSPIVDGLFYENHSGIFGGAMGQGKTYFNLELSACAALGRTFNGRAINRPYKVAFIDTENGGGEMKFRIEKLSERLKLSKDELAILENNWSLIDWEDLDFPDLSKQRGFDILGDFLKDCQPELVIVDCFGKVFPGVEKDEAGIKFFCEQVKSLLREHECLQRGGIYFLHHLTKPNYEEAGFDLLDNPTEFLGKIRGSGRLLDFVQDRLAMQEQKSGDHTFIVVNGILRSAPKSPLLLQRDEDGFFSLFADKDFLMDRVFRTAERQKELFCSMREAYKAGGTFTYKQVKALPTYGKAWSENTVSAMLQKAASTGLIKKHGISGYEFLTCSKVE